MTATDVLKRNEEAKLMWKRMDVLFGRAADDIMNKVLLRFATANLYRTVAAFQPGR